MEVYLKSRTHVVLLPGPGGNLTVESLWLKTEKETKKQLLVAARANIYAARDELIHVLVQAGLHVRFFDPEEQQWMEDSVLTGPIRVSGQRDGQWSRPGTEEFLKDYLQRT